MELGRLFSRVTETGRKYFHRGCTRNPALCSASAAHFLAEGVGFEPTIRLPVYTLSKRAPSAARPSLRIPRDAPREPLYIASAPAAGKAANCRAPRPHPGLVIEPVIKARYSRARGGRRGMT